MIDDLVNLILYTGPTIKEIIEDAIKNKNEFNIRESIECDFTEIVVKSIVAYGIQVEDKYIYNNEKKLIKQSLIINDSEKIIFDKYKEISEMINIKDSKVA